MRQQVRGRTKTERIALEEIRLRAVRAVRAGESVEAVAKTMAVTKRTVYGWVAAYRIDKNDALLATKAAGAQRKLTEKQRAWLSETVTSKSPRQLQMDFGLWTRDLVRSLIRKKFGVTLAVTSVGYLLKELGFTAQRPLIRAYQQDPDRIKRWLRIEYPRIRREAKTARAEIFFADEAGIRTDYHAGTTWSPKGKTPVVYTTGVRKSCNMLSAVSARGALRFMVRRGTVTTDVFIEFLRRLMDGATRPIFLIVDGHPTHRAKRTQAYVAATRGKLKLFYLPPYAPELNPDELVWRQVKHHGVGREPILDDDDLARRADSHLRSLQKRPATIKAFFQAPTTSYAAL